MPVEMRQTSVFLRPHRVRNITHRAFKVTAHAHALSAAATSAMEPEMPCPTRRDIMLLSAALLSYQASYPKVFLTRLITSVYRWQCDRSAVYFVRMPQTKRCLGRVDGCLFHNC